MLQKLLEKIGLSDKEAKTYLTLLELGPSRVSIIAQKTKIERTTTYGILSKLKNRGVVSSVTFGRRLEFQALDPRLLPQYIERLQKEMDQYKTDLKKALPQFEDLRRPYGKFPKIEFFEGIEGLKQAYEDTLENNKEKMLYDLTGTDAVFNLLGKDWVEYYVKKRTELGIKVIDIAPDTQISRDSQKQDKEFSRVTKLIPAKYVFNSEIDIYDDKVGIFSYSKEHPMAVLIQDENIAKTMKQIFNYINDSIASNK